jgi:hypothetical protein
MGYPETAGYKSVGTSQLAAESTDVESGRALVLQALAAGDKTSDEIALELNLSLLYVRPRVTELVKMGKVIASGKRKANTTIKNQSNKKANVWTLRKVAAKQVQTTMFETQRDGSSL